MKTKVFCIGFHKTGTTSLAVALEKLGYRVKGQFGLQDPNIATTVYPQADVFLAEFDAFQDNPWPIIYKYLDEKHPGSKFILTVRKTESWIASQVRHFGKKKTAMRRWIYGDAHGCPVGNEKIYTDRYEQHNAEVLDYFKDRPDDLLVIELSKGEIWEKLCPFLGMDIPDIPFPHANEATDRESKSRIVSRVLRKLKLR